MIRLSSFRALPSPVSSHPDLLLAPLQQDENGVTRRLLTLKGYGETLRNALSAYEVGIDETDETPGDVYPRDILLDALRVGDCLYGRVDAAAEKLRHEVTRTVPVRQGYARCSVAMLTSHAAVTADRSLAEALRADGIEVLCIRPGHIGLPGYDTGFIGGAGGRIDGEHYGFFGDLQRHPDGERIEQFARAHGVIPVSLSGEPLTDCGGLLGIKILPRKSR